MISLDEAIKFFAAHNLRWIIISRQLQMTRPKINQNKPIKMSQRARRRNATGIWLIPVMRSAVFVRITFLALKVSERPTWRQVTNAGPFDICSCPDRTTLSAH